MTDYEIDPVVWFAERQLSYPPVHFVTVHTPLTEESRQWVLNKLRGRFAVTIDPADFMFNLGSLGCISFEDPKEATLFELKWS
jgi:hypothetical protein